MKVSAPIDGFLREYARKNPVRCHMPGGKGKNNPFDITEIEGADSLFESSGIIAQSEENAAKLFGAGKTLYSCGGSTLSVQTMLALAKAENPDKNRVIAGRYCHKSLISACVLLGLTIDWVFPEEYLSCKIKAEDIREKIRSDTLCVFVQSIDYYGGMCDIESISEVCTVCREKKLPLLVDNAHGAYLVFTKRHPLKLGADMTADSAHKTLPCLTGCGYLHIRENSPFIGRAKELMGVFGSSSPSYLMLQSLDLCNRFIYEEKERVKRVFLEIKKLKKSLSDLGLKLYKSDPMRITIDGFSMGYSGFQLSRLLEERNIYCEYCDSRYVVLMFSVSQSLGDFDKILRAIRSIPQKEKIGGENIPIIKPKAAVSPREAVFGKSQLVPLKQAKGKICGKIRCSCPPCVPIVMPGEVYSDEALEIMRVYGTKQVRILK